MMKASKSSQVFAVVDCNNFFVSCERVFQPHLNKRPVVVLSNNDGCAISRSNEAKALGIKMGEPFFKFEHLVKAHNVAVFSSNFPLYSDLSQRIMSILQEEVHSVEMYSIDEAFLDLSHIPNEHRTQWMLDLKAKIYQWVGVPVSIGCAETKTLAKVAVHYAKKSPKTKGVLDLTHSDFQNEALKRLPIEEIWGVGRKTAQKCRSKAIQNAYDFKGLQTSDVLKLGSSVLARTHQELQGVLCFLLEDAPDDRKNMAFTRSFGTPVESKEDLHQVFSEYAGRLGHKLRKHQLEAVGLYAFIRSNPFDDYRPYVYHSQNISFIEATNSTPDLMKASHAMLEKMYREGVQYKKAGLIALGLQPAHLHQRSLFEKPLREREDALMKTLDRVQNRFGRSSLQYASAGIQKAWWMKQNKRSSDFTMHWGSLLTIEI
jgi:DNA polymerase V